MTLPLTIPLTLPLPLPLPLPLTLPRSLHPTPCPSTPNQASRTRRLVEPLGIVMLTAMLCCCLPFLMKAIVPCTPVGPGANNSLPALDNSSTLYPDYFCRREDNLTIGCENSLQLVMHRLVCGSSEERSEG